jgi:hypothetical protein
MVHDSDASEVRPRDSNLFVTQLDDPEQPWVEEPPQFEVNPLGPVLFGVRSRQNKI